jgi:hypothetical protein
MPSGRRVITICNFNRRAQMLDIVFIVAALAFFAVSALFVRACERV